MTNETVTFPETLNLHDTRSEPGREASFALSSILTCERLKEYVAKGPPLYRHQAEALQAFVDGEDVCLSTGTASGKTVLFHGAHVRSKAERSGSKTLALYPMKALAFEQEERWRHAFPDQRVGRVDGDVTGPERDRIIRMSDVLITTPDVWHASLLAKAKDPSVGKFLSHLGLITLDEAHTYTGVFGSNSAYLLRRLRHAACLLSGRELGFVAASATLKNPEQHLRNLTGIDFKVIGRESDGAPRHPMTHHFVQPAPSTDPMRALSDLLKSLAQEGRRFLAFADSRKQVELVADLFNRGHVQEDEEDTEGDILDRFSVLPYRAGYDDQDRRRIQERLTDPKLLGIVATSSMELGLDIPNLDAVVFIGVPNSATSLHQRIGRVGRSKPGHVIVFYTGSVVDQYVWEDTSRFMTRPLQESALYLGNRRIQYIHAMCLARPGGENDTLTGTMDAPIQGDLAEWPTGFLDLCEEERTGQIDAELDAMKGEAGDEPHRRFPLRSCDSQFRIVVGTGNLGQLSYGQALREAYPGGVYRHLMEAYRVYRVNVRSKEILVRREKRYVTKPKPLPVKVMPNVQPGRIRHAIGMGDAIVLEGDAQIREAVGGFEERRGQTDIKVTYPNIAHVSGVMWPHPMFSNQYGSSAIALFHPALEDKGIEFPVLSNLFFEALLLAQPFERNDLGEASGVLGVSFMNLKGCHFLSVFDGTNGSLRLSGRFLEDHILEDALSILEDVASGQGLKPETQRAVSALAESAQHDRQDLLLPEPTLAEDKVTIILPGSVGWSLPDGRQEFVVDSYFVHPKDGLKYRGHLKSWEKSKDNGATMSLSIEAVEIVPGESKVGLYDYETGEVIPVED